MRSASSIAASASVAGSQSLTATPHFGFGRSRCEPNLQGLGRESRSHDRRMIYRSVSGAADTAGGRRPGPETTVRNLLLIAAPTGRRTPRRAPRAIASPTAGRPIPGSHGGGVHEDTPHARGQDTGDCGDGDPAG